MILQLWSSPGSRLMLNWLKKKTKLRLFSSREHAIFYKLQALLWRRMKLLMDCLYFCVKIRFDFFAQSLATSIVEYLSQVFQNTLVIPFNFCYPLNLIACFLGQGYEPNFNHWFVDETLKHFWNELKKSHTKYFWVTLYMKFWFNLINAYLLRIREQRTTVPLRSLWTIATTYDLLVLVF